MVFHWSYESNEISHVRIMKSFNEPNPDPGTKSHFDRRSNAKNALTLLSIDISQKFILDSCIEK